MSNMWSYTSEGDFDSVSEGGTVREMQAICVSEMWSPMVWSDNARERGLCGPTVDERGYPGGFSPRGDGGGLVGA